MWRGGNALPMYPGADVSENIANSKTDERNAATHLSAVSHLALLKKRLLPEM